METRRNNRLARQCDLAIVGAGAAGLAAAISAGEAAQGGGLRIALLEGARKPGAKILVSGGGRCNVTNAVVTEKDFWGGSSHTIRKVLNAFGNQSAIAWFGRLGVSLKREALGKMFPVTDRAQTVLTALVEGAADRGIDLQTGARVTDVRTQNDGFDLMVESHNGPRHVLHARRVICATGGLALPKSGSDGTGLSILQQLGHTVIPTTPALVPLILRPGPSIGGRFAEFQGITLDVRLRLCRGQSQRPLVEIEGSMLFTHFGVSGPAAMNLSRHWLRAQRDDPESPLRVLLGVPELRTCNTADEWLQGRFRAHPRSLLRAILEDVYPSRLASAVADTIGSEVTASQITRADRRRLATLLAEMALDVAGSRGYTFAEATAGGVDLRDIAWRTMESRRVPGLHLCGEVLDVDGRIGGFNFQWAWSSGYLAGRGAVAGLDAAGFGRR